MALIRPTTSRWCAVVLAVVAAVPLTACATTIDGVPGANRGDVVAYRESASAQSAAVSASREAQQRTNADYAVCAAATSGAVTSLRAYNAFATALNATQDYGALRGKDREALTEIDRTAKAIASATTDSVSVPISRVAGAFVQRGSTLARTIAERRSDGLNAAGSAWIRARDDVVRVCAPYGTPAGGSSSSPAPAPPGG